MPCAPNEYAMEFFWIPSKVKDSVMKHYGGFQMRFSAGVWTACWVDLQFGIPIGCAISPILIVLAMEVITKAVERSGSGIAFSEGEELPPIRAFMDDLTLLCPSTEAVESILSKLGELMDWGRMRLKKEVKKFSTEEREVS